MTLVDYFKDKIFSIVILVLVESISSILLWLIGVRGIFIIFFELLFFIGFFIVLISDFIKKSRYYKLILSRLDQLEEKTLLSEMIIEGAFLDSKILYEILKESNKYMNDKIAQYEDDGRQYREYIELWVHEIKTPITSAKLIIENDKNITTLHISDQLSKIDRFVEQVLFYARSTSLEKDFKVEKTNLKDLVITAVKTYSKSIIQVGGRLQLDSLDIQVYSDSKWLSFVIGQVIANSIKYKRENLCITIKGDLYENGVSLVISDNGIGIPAKDLQCVFNKGFTGENGRYYNESTGIGLYLCKKLCKKMNIDITISSEVNVGTEIKIHFPKNSLILQK